MTPEWPEPVERVARVLPEGRVEARIEEFKHGTPTAADAAGATGAPIEQIVKSLVFSCDGRAIVVMVPGDARADFPVIEKIPLTDRAPDGFVWPAELQQNRFFRRAGKGGEAGGDFESLKEFVTDETRMTGNFHFGFTYRRVDAADVGATEATPIFDALREALGLRLERRKGPVEFLVVDRAERIPSEN